MNTGHSELVGRQKVIIVGSGNVVGGNVIVNSIDQDSFTVSSLGSVTLRKVVGEWKV